jgi:hypothetical protein
VKTFDVLFKSLERTRNSTEVLKQIAMQLPTSTTDMTKESVLVKEPRDRPGLKRLSSSYRANLKQHSGDEDDDDRPTKRQYKSKAGSAALQSPDSKEGNSILIVDGPSSANLRWNPVSPSRLVDSGGMLLRLLTAVHLYSDHLKLFSFLASLKTTNPVSITPPPTASQRWALLMFYRHKLGTNKKMDTDWCKMFRNEPIPYIDSCGIDRDINLGNIDIGLSWGYEFSVFLGSTVPEISPYVNRHFPNEHYKQYDRLQCRLKHSDLMSVLEAETFIFYTRQPTVPKHIMPSHIFLDFFHQMANPSMPYPECDVMSKLQELFYCRGILQDDGRSEFALKLFAAMFKSANRHLWSSTESPTPQGNQHF